MIILDFGSGNTCQNNYSIIYRMIDELSKVDSRKQRVIIKWQLFDVAGHNLPLRFDAFDYAYWFAQEYGYETTASVFDADSLKYLLTYDVPFIKIANRPDLYHLADYIGDNPQKHWGDARVLISGKGGEEGMFCVSEYPATVEQYEKLPLYEGCKISDHTTDFTLYHKYKPEIYECHYKLSDSTGLDAGSFSRTVEQLAEIL